MRAGVADNKWNVDTTTWPAVWWPRIGDERLARLAARGSPRAFAAVYERYHQVLFRYCRSIVRDDADAQDALQSTFTRALSALQRGQRSAPLRPWLFRIAHNEAISVLRRRRRGDEPLAGAPLPAAPSAEDQAGERARMAVLLGDLAALPDRSRSALVMRELSGLSHEEIAIALDTTPGAAKQAIFEARRGLLECAEGRAMPCAEVCQAISDGDRRILRGRRMRAHLSDCASCAAFAASIDARQSDLRALVPALPAAASAAVLARALGTAVGSGGGGAAAAGAGGAAGAAGKAIGVAFTSKGFATASVLATAAVSVGGVAAVVRFAPDAGRLFKAPGRHAAIVRSAPRARSAAPVRPARHATATRASATGGGLVRSGGNTATTGRHARLVSWPGHGRAVTWRRSTFGADGQFERGRHGRGDAGRHRGRPVAGQVAGHHARVAPGFRDHAAFEPSGGARGRGAVDGVGGQSGGGGAYEGDGARGAYEAHGARGAYDGDGARGTYAGHGARGTYEGHGGAGGRDK
jgi:RNA polymerase sigma factor (sigma-70 family)